MHFFAGAAKACGTNNQAHVGRNVEAIQRFAEFVALFTLNSAGNAAGAGVIGHQNKIATGKADKGGQGCTLVATLFLFDLDDHFLAFAQDFLDVNAAFWRLLEVLAGNFFEREESVAVSAKVDESRFEAGLDAGDLAFVDVGFLLFAGTGFDIEIEQALAVDQCDTQLFRLSCVN